MSKKVSCSRCGRSSFRYSKKDKMSYCLTCGLRLEDKAWEQMKDDGKTLYDNPDDDM